MLKTKTRPTTAAPTDFATARERFAKAKADYEEKKEAAEIGRLALDWSHASETERGSDRLRYIRKRVTAAYPRGLPRHRKLVDQVNDAIEAFQDAKPAFEVEQELYQAALRRETNRIAAQLQPRHRAAVHEIAAALEQLSRALQDEAEVRAELRRQAPLPDSPLLPNAAAGLSVGSLADWSSPASEWARRMRKLKVLE